MSSPFPAIPYGRADFEAIRREGCLYVDKTRFLHALERERYTFLIRPRRFGKSLWAAVLASYYDRNRADRFETIFAGVDVGRRPTPNRHRYVVLHFDFSAFDNTLETLRERFETYCFIELRHALERNADLFPEPVRERILAHPSIDAKFRELFLYAGDRGIPLYVIIDEYDNFANTVLAHRGPEAYRSFTHGGGFYRNFFAALKAGGGSGGRPRAPVRHRRLADHDGRRDQRSTSAPTSASTRNSTSCSASPRRRCGACWSGTAISARSTRAWTRPST